MISSSYCFRSGSLKNKIIMERDLSRVSELLKRVSEQECFYQKFGIKVDFSDLKKKIKEGNLSGKKYDKKDYFIIVIPKAWSMEKSLEMLKKFFRVEMKSVLCLSGLQSQREGKENYLLAFPLNGKNHSCQEVITITERIMLEVQFFFEKKDNLDKHLPQPLMCLGSRRDIREKSIRAFLCPFMRWNDENSVVEFGYALPQATYLQKGVVGLIN
jgi:hypothetical protein